MGHTKQIASTRVIRPRENLDPINDTILHNACNFRSKLARQNRQRTTVQFESDPFASGSQGGLGCCPKTCWSKLPKTVNKMEHATRFFCLPTIRKTACPKRTGFGQIQVPLDGSATHDVIATSRQEVGPASRPSLPSCAR